MSGPGRVDRLAGVTARLRRAAHDAGVDLPADYARRVTIDGLARCDRLAVTRLGHGVVLHTTPGSHQQLPIVLGYADGAGQWYRDGSRHTPPEPTGPGAGVEAVGL